MDRNRVIGVDNALPWRLPADLKRFRALTTGHSVIMGRKTHESIGRPLPNRTNVVVTRQPAYRAPGCTVARSLDEAFAVAARSPGAGEVFVIGGADIYRQAIDRADTLYLTEVDTAVPRGDAHFPEVSPAAWRVESRTLFQAGETGSLRYAFVTYVRR